MAKRSIFKMEGYYDILNKIIFVVVLGVLVYVFYMFFMGKREGFLNAKRECAKTCKKPTNFGNIKNNSEYIECVEKCSTPPPKPKLSKEEKEKMQQENIKKNKKDV